MIREALLRVWDTQADAAVAVGMSEQTISRWVREGVPASHAVEIERASRGAITREELRPDLFGPIDYDDGEEAAA